MLPPGKLATGARSELEPFLKEQPENDGLMGDLALTNRVAAFAARPSPQGRRRLLNCGWRLWVIFGL